MMPTLGRIRKPYLLKDNATAAPRAEAPRRRLYRRHRGLQRQNGDVTWDRAASTLGAILCGNNNYVGGVAGYNDEMRRVSNTSARDRPSAARSWRQARLVGIDRPELHLTLPSATVKVSRVAGRRLSAASSAPNLPGEPLHRGGRRRVYNRCGLRSRRGRRRRGRYNRLQPSAGAQSPANVTLGLLPTIDEAPAC